MSKVKEFAVTQTGNPHVVKHFDVVITGNDMAVFGTKQNVAVSINHTEHGKVVIPCSKNDAVATFNQKEINLFNEITNAYD